MRGIILAGGAGSRLHPMTQVVCKQLLPIYDKPMIYYPLSLLMLSDIREVLIISTAKDTPMFRELLGDGEQLGMRIEYKVQDKPNGLPEAFILGADFIQNDDVTMILGDNMFYGSTEFLKDAIKKQRENSGSKAQIFGYQVDDPRRYGVVEFDKTSGEVISLEEKPNDPKSHFAIPGLYVFDGSVSRRARELKPSNRGETEIIDLIKNYMQEGGVSVHMIGRGLSWFDAGTPESLLEAANFIGAIEKRQGLKVGCLLEVAARKEFISLNRFSQEIERLPSSPFRQYLSQVYSELNEETEKLSK